MAASDRGRDREVLRAIRPADVEQEGAMFAALTAEEKMATSSPESAYSSCASRPEAEAKNTPPMRRAAVILIGLRCSR